MTMKSLTQILVASLVLWISYAAKKPEDVVGQCTQILDSVTSSFDYISRDGEVIGLLKAGVLTLQCIPEDGGSYSSSTSCNWLADGNGIPSDFNQKMVFLMNRCVMRYHLTSLTFGMHTTEDQNANNNGYVNYTCVAIDPTKDRNTTMSYIIFFDSEEPMTGIKPAGQEKEVRNPNIENGSISLGCEIDVGATEAVMSIDWFHKSADGSLRDVTTMPNHAITRCESTTSGWVLSTLTVNPVTEDLYNTEYICKARKYDTYPYTSIQNFGSYYLHSANLSSTKWNHVLAAQKPTVHTVEFYNSSGACTLNDPCMAERTFLIEPPNIIYISIALQVGLSIAGGMIAFIVLVAIILYIRRALLLNKVKHKWGFTKDLEDSKYDYHAVVFYSNKTPSEECFVQNELLVKLENKWKYKTCVPQRDFLIGCDKAGVCVDALEKSQRSIFVLTEDMFLEDWNLYCLDVALQEHRKIIIIKRQEIDFEQLLADLGSRYSQVDSALKVASVIDWPKDRFKWAWLHYRLPAINPQEKRRQLSSIFKHEEETRVRSWSKSKLEAVDNPCYSSNNTINTAGA